MSQCGSLWSFPAWSSLSFLDVYIHIFNQIWEFDSYYFFKFFAAPFSVFSFWDSYNVYLVRLTRSHRFLKLSSFFFTFFLFLRLGNFQCLIFNFASPLFLLVQTCCWIPLLHFSFQLLQISAPEFVWLLFIISVSLFIFSFCSDIVFLISISVYSWFPLENILNILTTIDLTSLTNNSKVWSSLGMVSVKFFISCEWIIFSCCFTCFITFLLRTGYSEHYIVVTLESNSTPQGLLVFACCGLDPFLFAPFPNNFCKVYLPCCVWPLRFLFHCLYSWQGMRVFTIF